MKSPSTKTKTSFSSGSPLVTPESYHQCVAVIAGVDQVAGDAERRWGIGRLPLLVSDELRLRFREACIRWDAAIRSWQRDDVQRIGDMMRRAWAALEAEAISLGHAPLTPTTLEAPLEGGQVLVVVSTPEEARIAAQQAAGRAVVVITMEEVARIYTGAKGDLRTAIVVAFPGATVRPVEQALAPGFAKDWSVGDPFSDLFGDGVEEKPQKSEEN